MKSWLLRIRTSGRLAFLLRLVVMFPSALLSLWWARALLHAMGANNYGLFMTFQGVIGLAALGDLGMGGALVIRTSRLLANNQIDELHRLHATARVLFLGFAAVGFTLIIFSSPWLPSLFRFVETPASGSLSALFIAGGFYALFVFLSGYYQTTLYAIGTVSWPVLPPILVFHLGSAFQLLCAIYYAPLWLQLVPTVVLAAGCLLLYRQMVHATHPDLSGPFPLKFEPSYSKALLQSSFWAYLLSISYYIYITTDRLMVNAGFGASEVTPYLLNFKLSDLALTIIMGIGYVSLPKVAVRILSPDSGEKREGCASAEKLRKIQIFLGCAAGIFYLTVNDAFIRWWFGTDTAVSLNLQMAFAFTLVVIVSTDVTIQLWIRLSEASLQKAAIAAIVCALINLGLSYVAMSVGWIAGVAWATWVARAIFGLLAMRVVCPAFQLSSGNWLKDVFLIPMSGLLISFFLIKWISPHTMTQWLVLIGSDLVILLLIFFLCGLRPSLFREEVGAFRSLLKSS